MIDLPAIRATPALYYETIGSDKDDAPAAHLVGTAEQVRGTSRAFMGMAVVLPVSERDALCDEVERLRAEAADLHYTLDTVNRWHAAGVREVERLTAALDSACLDCRDTANAARKLGWNDLPDDDPAAHGDAACWMRREIVELRTADTHEAREVLRVLRELGPSALADCYGIMSAPTENNAPLDIALAAMRAADAARSSA